MILCTYRDTDVDRSHPLSAMLADLRRMEGVNRIPLGGLGTDGVRELLVRTGGHELDEEGLRFADMIQRETSGNPFFLGEVLRHLAETGALYERDGRWVSDRQPEDAGIPEGIREVVGRRLSRLGDDVEAVLRAAAVIGYEFDVDLLAEVVGRERGRRARRPRRRDGREPGARGRGRPPPVRPRPGAGDAARRDSRRAAGRAEHRKVAEAIEARHAGDLDVVVAELATHWTEASAGGDPSRAIELSVRAGGARRRARRDGTVPGGSPAPSTCSTTTWPPTLNAVGSSCVSPSPRRCPDRWRRRANALRGAAEAIAAGDTDTRARRSPSVPGPASARTNLPTPERVELLRSALAMDGHAPQQRATLLGELAVELIFERDISGRRAALEEYDRIVDALPPAERRRFLEHVEELYQQGDAAFVLRRIDDVVAARAVERRPPRGVT